MWDKLLLESLPWINYLSTFESFLFNYFSIYLLDVSDTASINVALSRRGLRKASSARITANSSPTIGSANFRELACGYTRQDGTGFITLAVFNRTATPSKMVIPASVTPSLKARLSVTLFMNKMVLDVSNMTLDDEKRKFYCNMTYACSGVGLVSILSKTMSLADFSK